MKTTTVKNIKVNPLMIAYPYAEGYYRFWEVRMKLDDIFEELALPWNTENNVVEMAHAIVNYCKENTVMPVNVAWGVEGGILYANDKPIKRVGPKWA